MGDAVRPAVRNEGTRYALLFGSVMALVAIEGAVPPGAIAQVVVSVLLGASVVLAAGAARLTPRLARIAYALAAAGVVVALLRALTGAVGDGEARAMNALVAALGPPAVAVAVVRNMRESDHVRVEAVMGGLTLYLLLGMVFAFTYGAVDRLGGGPFFADGAPATVAHCMYFSFTTLTTVGYGDLTARTDLGHTLGVFEALLGQIYLVTVVSLIVGNLGRTRPSRTPRP